MLATTSLSPKGLWRGVAGDPQIQPYAIVVVFLGLAYLAAALDATGALACAALAAARRSRGQGRPLYLAFYALSSLMTVCTSNDVCVMALAPLILYTCAASGQADPTLYLYSMFAASNLASIALMFGNPTNLIVAVASEMTFLSYAKAMVLPAAAAVAAALAWMFFVQRHRSKLPESVAVPDTDPKSLLSDPWGAAWSTFCLVACLASLAAAPSVGWPLWPPVLACCALQFVFSVGVYGIWGRGGGWGVFFEREKGGEETAVAGTGVVELAGGAAAGEGGAPSSSSSAPPAAPLRAPASMSALPLLPSNAEAAESSAGGLGDPEAPTLRQRRRSREEASAPPLPAVVATVAAAAAAAAEPSPEPPPPPAPHLLLEAPQPNVLGPLAALPLHIIPFVLGMFCMVEGLSEVGATDALGRALGRATAGGNPYLSALVVGLAATVACNAINNQPMTVLFTRALLSPGGGGFVAGVGVAAGAGAGAGSADAALRAALFATVIASNVGANFTLVGALAGVMFADIVKRKEREAAGLLGGGGGAGAGKGGAAAAAGAATTVDVSYWGFFRMLAPGGAASLVAALGVMMAQMAAGGW
jgi:Na+/H+ antiporter NhaD/arsenite permease-like protein